jgi:PadR family transcriptional regulator, regulatory protein PadR
LIPRIGAQPAIQLRVVGPDAVVGVPLYVVQTGPLPNGKISSYTVSMRRRSGVLIPLEVDILRVAAASPDPWIHGFAMAKLLADARGSSRLTGHGTLYKALGRLADGGLLEDRWEDPEIAMADGRPRRRLYKITASGAAALAAVVGDERAVVGSLRRARVAPA